MGLLIQSQELYSIIKKSKESTKITTLINANCQFLTILPKTLKESISKYL